MHAHGLATIAMCEAYGLSQMQRSAVPLRRPSTSLPPARRRRLALWASKQAGDMSVAGWQIMAIKSGQMAGLDVPAVTVRKAIAFLDSCSHDEGYGYNGPAQCSLDRSRPAVPPVHAELGTGEPRMQKSAAASSRRTRPTAMPTLLHMQRKSCITRRPGLEGMEREDARLPHQEAGSKTTPCQLRQRNPQGDAFGQVGGRLMLTSLNLLTLEVYYRYLPLYYRDAGYGKMDDAVKKGV